MDESIEPEELLYKETHIRALFEPLETDYYDRYEFADMQKYDMGSTIGWS